MRRSAGRGEDLLGLSTARRAIAAAPHFAGDDGGPQRLLGAPVGRVEGRVKEEAKNRFKLGDQMLLKAPDGQPATRRALEQAAEPRDQCPRATASPCADTVPAAIAGRAWPSAACSTALTATTKGCPG